MRSFTRSFSVLLATSVLVASVACAGSAAPTPQPIPPPPTPTPVVTYVLAPTGVGSDLWSEVFSDDMKLRRPDGVVHLILPLDISVADRALASGYVDEMNSWGLKVRWDLVDGAAGATIPISIVPGLMCGLIPASGCMTASYTATGYLVGKKVEFVSPGSLRNKRIFFHEAIRCLGVEGLSPRPGILYLAPSGERPTDEELLALKARENFPLLSVCGIDANTPCAIRWK